MSDWKPEACLAALRLRARLLARIRDFFADRGILEVETPLLGRITTLEPHVESLRVPIEGETLYLQTSPEHAMKRLVAAGSGPIYQIGKAFRSGESGARHHREFTLVEWYRPGLDTSSLMDEVSGFVEHVLGCRPAERESYAAIFARHLGVDPHSASPAVLERTYWDLGLPSIDASGLDRADWLDLLMAEAIEPKIGGEVPLLIFDYPVELAANARVRGGRQPVADRFELYFRGLELANGYGELTDAIEQRHRFVANRRRREELGRHLPPIDDLLLQAMEAGFPECSGVALGFDRLVMIAASARTIADVLSFREV
ncbi:MAG TPA: EF-P lysine aminoacylase EpmA [Vicinamibacteria bacterium]|nr:EF-P lysine aminoacylase EpmA [Vicinamibacteria bacterium]